MTKVLNKDLRLLGLNEKEEVIIKTLKEFGTLRPIDITRKTLINRTTVNFLLNKLLVQGLIKKDRIKRHYEWSINNEDYLKNRIDFLYKYFCTSSVEGVVNIPPEIGVEVFKGRKRIIEVYEKVLKAGRNNRVFIIQGNKSIKAAEKLDKVYFRNIQKKFKINRIIMEGIIGEKSLNFFHLLDLDTLKAYEDRLVVGYITDDKLVDFDMDILIFKKTVMLINFENNTVVVIKNQAIYDAFLHLYEVLKMTSQKIDINEYIRNLIKTKTNP